MLAFRADSTMGEGADVLIVRFTFFVKIWQPKLCFRRDSDQTVQTAVDGQDKLYASPAIFLLSDTIVFQTVHFTRNKCGIL